MNNTRSLIKTRKVSRVIKFNEDALLKPYTYMNSELWKQKLQRITLRKISLNHWIIQGLPETKGNIGVLILLLRIIGGTKTI